LNAHFQDGCMNRGHCEGDNILTTFVPEIVDAMTLARYENRPQNAPFLS
jgi:hypothetical protein